MNTKQLIDEAVSLPVEARVLVVDSLLRSLNRPEPELDMQWAAVAQRRLVERRNGSVAGVPGQAVFEKIRNSPVGWARFCAHAEYSHLCLAINHEHHRPIQ